MFGILRALDTRPAPREDEADHAALRREHDETWHLLRRSDFSIYRWRLEQAMKRRDDDGPPDQVH